MNKYEFREWTSIAPADIPVWLAGFSVLGIILSTNFWVDITLSFVALGLTIFACIIGMRFDPRISNFSNRFKQIAYPICVLLVIGVILHNFSIVSFF